MNIKEDEIINELNQEKCEKIILEIESLKPSKYAFVIEVILRTAVLGYIFIFMPDDSFLMDNKMLLVFVALALFGGGHSDSRIHKRIDALLHLVNTKTLSNETPNK